jgi:hypothetical protein
MKRRTKVRIFSFTAAVMLALGGFIAQSQFTLYRNQTELEYTYRRALNDLTDYVSDMEFSLRKSMYANTATMRTQTSAELLEQSSSAKASMAILPFDQERTEKISRFISQVGDYAMALSRKSASGGEISDDDLKNLATMEKYSRELADALKEVQAHLSVEKAAVGKTYSALNNVDEFDNIAKFDDSMDDVAHQFSEFPDLLYDGPFSDHIMQQKPKLLEGKKEIGAKEALKIAEKFLDDDKNKLSESGASDSKLSSYVFETRDENTIHVTKFGGEVSFFKKTISVPESKLSYEEALKKASGYLTKLGIKSHKESYYTLNDNTCTINFSYLIDGEEPIICYPDLIKVVIDLNDGGMVEYDATGYIMNHHKRKIGKPKLSVKDAEKKLSKKLTAQSHALAVIPTPGLDEVFCYEFKCKDDQNTDFLVYINADTGMEEQLFILTYSDSGVLTI